MEDEKTYRIGEVAKLLHLKPYTLHFWEKEFTQIMPLRTEKGQRVYTCAHINLLRRIKHLLHERGLSIKKAKRILDGSETLACGTPTQSDKEFIFMLQKELMEIHDLLSLPEKST